MGSWRRGRRLSFTPPMGDDFGGDGSGHPAGGAGGGGLLGLGGAGGIGLLSLFAALFSRGNSAETLKLLFYGAAIEVGRRVFTWLSERVFVRPSVSARFREGDPAYEWIMLYLTQENVWKKSRTFDVSAKSTRRKWHINASSYFAGVDPEDVHADYVPHWGTPHVFRYNGYWVDVVKSGHDSGGSNMHPLYGGMNMGGGSTISLTFFTGLTIKLDVLAAFVEDCRRRYLASSAPRVTIHLCDAFVGGADWAVVKTKPRRPLGSLALPDGVMDALLKDVREFLGAERWYADAGIPHHRGYLLHGPPGTGKTSTIYALAGELGLEIYSLSLAAGHIDDAYLQRLATAVPRGALLLIEDIDCAFPSREDEEEQAQAQAGLRNGRGQRVVGGTFMGGMPGMGMRTGVTLSGLLNVIDGVGSDDGRLFFATTNHFDRLDPALVRPGRVDLKIEYQKASPVQARALFERFFPASQFEEPPPHGALAPPALDADGLRRRASGPALPSPMEKESEPMLAPPASNSAPRDADRAALPARRVLSTPLAALADAFAAALPPAEFSAAEIQGFLLGCKWDPEAAANGAKGWVAHERAERAAQERREDERKRRARATAAGPTDDDGFPVAMGMGMGMGMGLPPAFAQAASLPPSFAQAYSPAPTPSGRGTTDHAAGSGSRQGGSRLGRGRGAEGSFPALSGLGAFLGDASPDIAPDVSADADEAAALTDSGALDIDLLDVDAGADMGVAPAKLNGVRDE